VRKLIWAIAALAGMASAHAGDLSYTYAEGGFGRVDMDSIDTGDGYFVGGSVAFGTNWLGYAEWSTSSFDQSGVSADVDEIQVGFGGHFPISRDVDFVGRLAYVDEKVDVSSPIGGASADDNGYMLSAGVRGHVVDKLDLMGSVDYVDLGDSGTDTGLALRGLYEFTDMFSLGARVGFSDDVTSYGVFARFSF
jgi:Outer membrane protein beta-barrel domain